MAIEYLLVTFTEERAVLADGNGVGFTNHVLMLPGDEYLITLEGEGYTPPSQDIVLAGTSIVRPLVIAFMPGEAAAPSAGAGKSAARAPAVAGARSRKKDA